MAVTPPPTPASPTRRRVLAAAAFPLATGAAAASADGAPARAPGGGTGRSRSADRGDGSFLNPVMAGDHPDPTVVRDGADYYMTFSSFEAVPGLLLWHSRDLVNWRPIGPALRRYIGSVWAPELCRHAGRWYLYVPAKHPQGNDVWVLHAERIEGPWSDPVPLGIDRIDPGHAVAEDGRRWLFLAGGTRVALSEDGLRLAGPIEHVYAGWPYPDEWEVESFSQEGPKMLFHRGWWYMTLAQGGTAGPATGHMVIAARARRLDGPWESSPYNPVVRTRSPAERWWSRGHATLVEGPAAGDWYMVYHGYENGYRTLGRQALLEPIEWTDDGWWRPRHAARDALAAPLPKPAGGLPLPPGSAHGLALDDDFAAPALAPQWALHRGGAATRTRCGGGMLRLEAAGSGPADSPPLTFVAGDHAYRVEVDIEIEPGVQAGLLLFYSERLYAGLGFDARGFVLHRYGLDVRRGTRPPDAPARLRVRMDLRGQVATFHTSADDGARWVRYGTRIEVSGYHHNVAGGFMSLRPGLYAAGRGQARFARLRYRALQEPSWN